MSTPPKMRTSTEYSPNYQVRLQKPLGYRSDPRLHEHLEGIHANGWVKKTKAALKKLSDEKAFTILKFFVTVDDRLVGIYGQPKLMRVLRRYVRKLAPPHRLQLAAWMAEWYGLNQAESMVPHQKTQLKNIVETGVRKRSSISEKELKTIIATSDLLTLTDFAYRFCARITNRFRGRGTHFLLIQELYKSIYSNDSRQEIGALFLKLFKTLEQFYLNDGFRFNDHDFIKRSYKALKPREQFLEESIINISHGGGLRHLLQFLQGNKGAGHSDDTGHLQGIFVSINHNDRDVLYTTRKRINFLDTGAILTATTEGKFLGKVQNGYEGFLFQDSPLTNVKIVIADDSKILDEIIGIPFLRRTLPEASEKEILSLASKIYYKGKPLHKPTINSTLQTQSLLKPPSQPLSQLQSQPTKQSTLGR